MPKFKNMKELEKFVNNQIKTSLEEIGKEVKQILHDYIDTNLYQAYQPNQYQRTYDFINSITVGDVKQIGKGYGIEVYFDTDKIRQSIVEDSKWNQHMSTDGSDTWNGVKINELIPYFMEYGVEGSKWDREGIYAVENTIETLEQTKKHVKELARIFKKRGFNINIK